MSYSDGLGVVCLSCGWRDDKRHTRNQAVYDAITHLRECPERPADFVLRALGCTPRFSEWSTRQFECAWASGSGWGNVIDIDVELPTWWLAEAPSEVD